MIEPVQHMLLDETALLRPFLSSKCSSILLQPSSYCSVCSSNAGKYKCPHCSTRTCSVMCFKTHKETTKCIVQTDCEQWKEIHVSSQFNDGVSINDQQFMHKIKERMKMDKTTDFVTKDQDKPSKISLSNDQRFLMQNAHLRRIWLHLDDASSSAGSRYERFSDTIFWSCTVKFVSRSSPTVLDVCQPEIIADRAIAVAPPSLGISNRPIVDYNGSDDEDIEDSEGNNLDRTNTEPRKMEMDHHNNDISAESGVSDGSSENSEDDEQQRPLEWMSFTVKNIPENIRVVTLLRQFLRPKLHGPVITLSQIDMAKMGPFTSASNSLLFSSFASTSSDKENEDKLLVYLEVSLNDKIVNKQNGEQTKEDFVRYYSVDPNRSILDNLRNRHVNGHLNFVVVLRRGREFGELELPLMSEEEQKQLQLLRKEKVQAMNERPKWQRKNLGGMGKGNFNWRGRRGTRGSVHQQQRHSADGVNAWTPNQRQASFSVAAQFQPTSFTAFHPYQQPNLNYNSQWRGQSSQQRGRWNAVRGFQNVAMNNRNRGGFP